jgi:hypothetical protein
VSRDTDRIAVPTNGERPAPPAATVPPAATAPFSPTQLAVGFGILASILVIVVRQIRQHGRPAPRGPFGRG